MKQLELGDIISVEKNYRDTKHSFGVVTGIARNRARVRVFWIDRETGPIDQVGLTGKVWPKVPSKEEIQAIIERKDGSWFRMTNERILVSSIEAGGLWDGKEKENTYYG